MMTWEVLDFVFIFHWNENEIFPVFSQSRVVLIQECFFPPSNSDHFFSLVFSPEMTRKATLSIRNQKTAQVIKPLSDTVFTYMCAKTHDKRHNKAAAAFTSRSNTMVAVKTLAARQQMLATFWKRGCDCALSGSHFLVSKYQSS